MLLIGITFCILNCKPYGVNFFPFPRVCGFLFCRVNCRPPGLNCGCLSNSFFPAECFKRGSILWPDYRFCTWLKPCKAVGYRRQCVLSSELTFINDLLKNRLPGHIAAVIIDSFLFLQNLDSRHLHQVKSPTFIQ